MKKEWRGKILVVLIALLATVVLSLAISFSHLFKTVFTSQRLEELNTHAEQDAHILEKDWGIQNNFVRSIQLSKSQSLIVIDREAHLKYQVGVKRFPDNVVSIPGQEQVLQGKPLLVKTADSPFTEPMFVAGVPVGSPVKGAVFLIEPAASGDQVIQTMNRVVALGVVGALLVAIGGALFITERMAQPLNQMEQVASAIMKGDFSKKVNSKGTDEISKLGNALNKLGSHLKNLQESRAEFLSNISHEIRTPLSYIQGYTQILAEGLVTSERERQQYIEIILDEMKRLQALLNDLFDLAKFEESRFEIKPLPVDIVPVIQKSITTLSPYAEQKKISLKYEGMQQLPSVLIDRERIEQVLLNLLHNAVQYSDIGGWVKVKTQYSHDQVYVSVEDNGPGIPKQELPLIWERFHRVDKSRDRSLGGTGLGLVIAKQIVEAHGGQIHAWSEIGQGTVVSFVLPRIDA